MDNTPALKILQETSMYCMYIKGKYPIKLGIRCGLGSTRVVCFSPTTLSPGGPINVCSIAKLLNNVWARYLILIAESERSQLVYNVARRLVDYIYKELRGPLEALTLYKTGEKCLVWSQGFLSLVILGPPPAPILADQKLIVVLLRSTVPTETSPDGNSKESTMQ
jgi:hypothetical protein